jgi:hypothetical protein
VVGSKTLLTHGRLGRKIQMTNTLAYWSRVSVTMKKKFYEIETSFGVVSFLS